MAVTEQLQEKILKEMENLGIDEINDYIKELEDKYQSYKNQLGKELASSSINTAKLAEIAGEMKNIRTSIDSLEEALYGKTLEQSGNNARQILKDKEKTNRTKEVIKNLNNPEKNFTNIQMTLEMLRLADQSPLLIGEKGIGKTATVRDYAKKIGADFVTIELSQIDPVEFMGYMIPEEAVKNGDNYTGTIDYDKVREEMSKLEGKDIDKILIHRHTMPSWVARILQNSAEGKPTVLFLDEINRGSKDVMNAVMNLILEKKFGPEEIKFPDNVFIVAAANPDDGEYSVLSFDKAQKDRVVEIEFTMTYQEWRNKVAPKIGIHDSIIRFLDENENFFYYVDEETDNTVSPRNWEKVSDFIKAYESIARNVNMNLRRNIETALKGILKVEKVADNYFAFYNTKNKLSYKDLKKLIMKEIDQQYKFIKDHEGTENIDEKVYDIVRSRIKTLLEQYEDSNTTAQDVLNEYVEGAIKEYVDAIKDIEYVETENEDNEPAIPEKKLLPIGIIMEIAGSSYVKTLEANINTIYGDSKEQLLIKDLTYLSTKFNSKLFDDYIEKKVQAISNQNGNKFLDFLNLIDGLDLEEEEPKKDNQRTP